MMLLRGHKPPNRHAAYCAGSWTFVLFGHTFQLLPTATSTATTTQVIQTSSLESPFSRDSSELSLHSSHPHHTHTHTHTHTHVRTHTIIITHTHTHTRPSQQSTLPCGIHSGKLVNLSIGDMIGGAHRLSIPVYASAGYYRGELWTLE